MVVYGYLRVSTAKQDENNYKTSILQLANEKDLGKVLWIQETISGRKDWRHRLLGQEFEKMKEGDIIVVGEYSRIGRDFLQSMEFLAECRRRGVKVYSTLGDIPMNNDATSNLLLAVTAWKNQCERENLAYRTKIGMAAHQAHGSVLGRRKEMILDKDINNEKKISEMLASGVKLKCICETFKCTAPTIRKYIKQHSLSKK
jgi:DNA invertase Pin-like site-specific DNA recombinase